MTLEHSVIWAEEFMAKRPAAEFRITLSVCHYSQAVYGLRDTMLHPREREYFESLQFERRIQSYLLGRSTAKQAVSLLTGVADVGSIWVRNGIFNQPIVTLAGVSNIGVSLSHSEEVGVAVAFPEEHPMGVDVEKISVHNQSILLEKLTDGEKAILQTAHVSQDTAVTLFWTIKESLSKVLKTGLTTPLQVYEISGVEWIGEVCVSQFKNFAQYKVISFVLKGYAFSLAIPRKTELVLELQGAQKRLLNYFDLF